MKKGERIIELFLNEPTRHWHFEEIMKTTGISRPQVAYWLEKETRKGLIKRIKKRGKMPHYIGNYTSPRYQSKKRLFALEKLEATGFMNHLASLPKAHAVILFGSFSRWDWYKESDIDLFVYGDAEGLDYGRYRKKLGREIQIFICKDNDDMKKVSPELLRNIVEGYQIKGTLDFVKVEAHA